MTHVLPISLYPMGNIFLQMPGSTLLVPYHGPQYHLSGWGHAQLQYVLLFYYFLLFFFSPATHEELFNLWHAKAQNVIERLFGEIK